MTWKKAAPLLVVSGVFDALRYFFLFFWFFGPALTAVYCAAKVGDTAVVGGGLTALCIAGAAALGVGGSALFIAFGTIMAIAVGYAGWFIAIFIIAATNSRALGDNPASILWMFEGLGASVAVMVWGIYRKQIQNDRAALKKYHKERAALQRQEQDQQMVEFMQAENTQQEQAEIY
jgi:hypothetical protein